MITDSVFNLEQHSLKLCEKRANLLTSNIANSTTPQYKARDFDFQAAIKAVSGQSFLQASNKMHLGGGGIGGEPSIAYRVPMQYSMDENTVDDEIERKNFVQNSINYEATLGFASAKAASLMKAIRGE